MLALSPNDVACGVGTAQSEHPGNVYFREIVRLHLHKFGKATTARDKAIVAKKVVKIIENLSPRGRFLRNDGPNGWIKLGPKAAADKTLKEFSSQAAISVAAKAKENSPAVAASKKRKNEIVSLKAKEFTEIAKKNLSERAAILKWPDGCEKLSPKLTAMLEARQACAASPKKASSKATTSSPDRKPAAKVPTASKKTPSKLSAVTKKTPPKKFTITKV